LKSNFNKIFNYYNSPLFVIQPKWICKRNIIYVEKNIDLISKLQMERKVYELHCNSTEVDEKKYKIMINKEN